MPRPSMKDARIEQILDGFERCVVEHGLQGASLEKIAESAGMQRQILRHYVGNRDDILIAYAKRFIARAQAAQTELRDALPEKHRVRAVVEHLFAHADEGDSTDTLLFDMLMVEAGRLDELRELLAQWFEGLLDAMAFLLHSENPAADLDRCRSVAFYILSAHLIIDSLAPIIDVRAYRDAGADTAALLIGALDK